MSSIPINHDLDNQDNSLQPKAIYAGDVWNGQPALIATDEDIILAADPTDAVIDLCAEFGVLISGKISLSATPDQITIGGGYWALNPLLTTCMPSTTPTPIPVLVKTTPPLLDAADDLQSAFSELSQFSDCPV
jgi:hypothetical protein